MSKLDQAVNMALLRGQAIETAKREIAELTRQEHASMRLGDRDGFRRYRAKRERMEKSLERLVRNVEG